MNERMKGRENTHTQVRVQARVRTHTHTNFFSNEWSYMK